MPDNYPMEIEINAVVADWASECKPPWLSDEQWLNQLIYEALCQLAPPPVGLTGVPRLVKPSTEPGRVTNSQPPKGGPSTELTLGAKYVSFLRTEELNLPTEERLRASAELREAPDNQEPLEGRAEVLPSRFNCPTTEGGDWLKEKNEEYQPAKKRRGNYAQGFEDFWKIYQSSIRKAKKQTKAKAYLEWNSCLKVVSHADLLKAARRATDAQLRQEAENTFSSDPFVEPLPDCFRWLRDQSYEIWLEQEDKPQTPAAPLHPAHRVFTADRGFSDSQTGGVLEDLF